MLRFILNRLFGSLVVIWVIITLSFLLMRFAPGSPFDADKTLPPEVEANKWIVYGMGDEVTAPVTGEVSHVAELTVGRDYDEGTLLARVKDASGEEHDVLMPESGRLVQLPATMGMTVYDGETEKSVEATPTILGTDGGGDDIISPLTGTVIEVATVRPNVVYPKGTKLCMVEDASGERAEVRLQTEGAVLGFDVEVGEKVDNGVGKRTKIPEATRLAVVPKGLLEQYVTALGNYAQLDFGVTFDSGGRTKVSENLLKGFPVSMELGLWALFFAFIFGVGAGFIAAVKQNTWVDYTLMSGAMIGISVPVIVTGPLFLLIFVEELGWVEFGGWESLEQKILPIMTLALVYIASFSRLARGGMLEVIRSDYIRTARAKGLNERTVVLRHAFKGAMLPSVSYIGPAIARIVTGSIVVERIYGISGLSEYFVTPAINRDYPMVIGVVVLYSTLLVLMNLIVDILYTIVDPRVSYD